MGRKTTTDASPAPTAAQQEQARANVVAAQAYKGPQKPRNPDGTLARPPSHAETLGALPDAPPDVKEEYARTGKTPPSDWRKAAVEAPEAPVRRGVPEGAADVTPPPRAARAGRARVDAGQDAATEQSGFTGAAGRSDVVGGGEGTEGGTDVAKE
jgi:hypothetical protein